ncbi:DNA-binding transcriptional MerR regulator [Enterococcus sp. PF1-24]|uniref:MerR family transcriptional regulator n=1 Tax=unclassified Enterococcus TaxID=2608891 RepID=UPI0024731E1D|nr:MULTISPECIES: MerR family transcriptional regulator [unclassified Enterococcus]MDH6363578.1 DNA-binding transcriptional MerR regulator [Enterococcus sp. PFB1-1]MDH6400813.1 DNA-binding transcriptional MerR regulator [Enterococcus sp. PF1-24]
MEYTIKKVAELSGVSSRTLRYYDELGLLKPARLNSAGYRIYGENEIDRLQQILFYRHLGFKLETIKEILNQADFDYQQALMQHYQDLLARKVQIDSLLTTVEKTLRHYKGEIKMKDSEKFTAFKAEKLANNENLYGQEIREKYGEEPVTAANQRWGNLTEADYQAMQTTEKELFQQLTQLTQAKDLTAPEAQAVYQLHKQWLSYSMPNYSTEIHKGLVDMYLADERFAEYYNQKVNSEATQWLRDAVYHYSK